MAVAEFKSASIRCTLDNGVDGEGKTVKKVKAYHNVTDAAGANEILAAVTVLTGFGTKPLMFLEKQTAQNIYA